MKQKENIAVEKVNRSEPRKSSQNLKRGSNSNLQLFSKFAAKGFFFCFSDVTEISISYFRAS